MGGKLVQILTGTDIGVCAQKIVQRGKKIYLAVAYWSGGAAKFLRVVERDNVHVVLDVKSGGTCPDELRALREHLGQRLRVLDGLHAKIYASESQALVGSANASRRGLHFKGQGNGESGVYFEGKDLAKTSYDLAKSMFDQGADVVDDHVRICEERFGTGVVSEQEFGKPEKLSLYQTLLQQPHVLRNMPVLVTTETVDDEVVRRLFDVQRGDLTL